MKRPTPAELDEAAVRLEQLAIEDGEIRAQPQEWVDEFGFTPPRADKSRRLEGVAYQFTLSRGVTTEVKDVEVERIRENCPGFIFDQLFKTTLRFKVAPGATQLLASPLPVDAPRNLRLWFSRAVETKESGPRLRIEKMECSTQMQAS
jgi:hypothetical protein